MGSIRINLNNTFMARKSKKSAIQHSVNLVGPHISRLAQQFFDLATQLERMRRTVRQNNKVGQYADCTVYKVKSSVVKEHPRRGYIAVRIRRPKTA